MFYSLARFFLWLYFKLYHRISVRGVSDLKVFLAGMPDRGPVILAANHESYLDPPAVGVAFPENLRFVAWEGLFKVPLLSLMIKALGAVPIAPENKGSVAGLMRQVMGFLDEKHSVLIFPEGQRTMDGELQPLEGGAALLSIKTGTPIVPVWIDGAWEAMSPYVTVPRPRKVTVTFGEPIFPDEADGENDRIKRKILTDSLNSALVALRDKGQAK